MDPGHLRETWQQDKPRMCIKEKEEGIRKELGKKSTLDYQCTYSCVQCVTKPQEDAKLLSSERSAVVASQGQKKHPCPLHSEGLD